MDALGRRGRIERCDDIEVLVKPSREGRCARKIRFSATRYSFCGRSCWLTILVTYAKKEEPTVLHGNARSYFPHLSAPSSILTIREPICGRDGQPSTAIRWG